MLQYNVYIYIYMYYICCFLSLSLSGHRIAHIDIIIDIDIIYFPI